MKLTIIICLLPAVLSCNNSFYVLKKSDPVPGLAHAQSKDSTYTLDVSREPKQTFKSFEYVDSSGRKIIFNEAVKDNNTGEMLSVRYLNEIVVSAKSQNISERNGVITLDFIIKIPLELQNNQWQINILPVLTRGKDTMHFSRIILSGEEFKRTQERGYKKYEKFLRSIIPDSVDFLEVYTDLPNLSLFLERNLPKSKVVSGIKNDTLTTVFGVSEKRILEYYIKQWLIVRNNKKKAEKEKMFEKYIKNPYLLGTRLDSVIKTINGDFLYHYSQKVLTNENTSRLILCLNGMVRDISGMSYILNPSDSLTYNVSSMISFIDTTKRYIKRIKDRVVTYRTVANIIFNRGKAEIIDSLSNNSLELGNIKNNIKDILSDNELVLDSIILTAASSPEGSFAHNNILSIKRATTLARFFQEYYTKVKEESIIYDINIDDNMLVGKTIKEKDQNLVLIRSRSIPEDWEGLRLLVDKDTLMNSYETLLRSFEIMDLDKREIWLSKYFKYYSYMRENLYPQLRRVTFSFNLHRKGMVKDTIHTTEIDTFYMSGIKLLKERRYSEALTVLREYKDFNTGIAHISLGQDNSAEEIFLRCPDSAYKIYLMAILAARKGNEEQAVKLFLRAKELSITMAYRGALDPEISSIIRKFNLNNDLFK